MTRWEGDSNENVCERRGMGPCANEVKCCVVEWVKINVEVVWLYGERKKSVCE